jgi:MFS family permease
MDPQYFPLLFVGTAFVYLLLAVPAGRLADGTGRRTLFLAGHVLLGAFTSCSGAPRRAPSWPPVSCSGLYASTDGVLWRCEQPAAAGLLTVGWPC